MLLFSVMLFTMIFESLSVFLLFLSVIYHCLYINFTQKSNLHDDNDRIIC